VFSLHPSTVLQTEVELRGMSASELALASGLPLSVVHGLLDGSVEIRAETAQALELGLGIPATLLLRLWVM
jgi:plasmid maintenance system antidote protein VapI